MSKEKNTKNQTKAGLLEKNGEPQDKSGDETKPAKAAGSAPKISKEKAEQDQHDKTVH